MGLFMLVGATIVALGASPIEPLPVDQDDESSPDPRLEPDELEDGDVDVPPDPDVGSDTTEGSGEDPAPESTDGATGGADDREAPDPDKGPETDPEDGSMGAVGSAGDGPIDTRILEIEAVGDGPVTYEITAARGLEGDDSSTEAESAVDGHSVAGELSGDGHRFELDGDVTTLVVDGPAAISIDGELVYLTDDAS